MINDTKNKYHMTLSLNVLNHLGMNLYSNIPAVLSEAIANAYDADAEIVDITITEDRVIIKDDGCGMTEDEINGKFLHVGYQRREQGEAVTPKFKRHVMGRKGIGKLSLFSIADTIEMHSFKNGKVNSLKMTKNEIQRQIKENNGTYYPEEIESLPVKEGTQIIIYDFKKNINRTSTFLKRRIARRFSIIGGDYNFIVKINGEEIGINDREFYNKLEFIWLIGEERDIYSDKFKNIKKVSKLDGSIEHNNLNFKISGWIGTVTLPSYLNEEGTNNNKVSIIIRGKVAQEDLLEEYTEGGIYVDYMIGEINADFLDNDTNEDIATSSRQKIKEDDERYIALKNKIYGHLKNIQNTWTELRNQQATEKILQQFPAVKNWYEELCFESYQEQARKLFKTIDRLHFDQDDIEEKRTLVKQSVLAFEQLKIRDNLDKIDKINSKNELELLAVFSQLNEIEAILYYDIARGRIKVIRELQEKIERNELENVIQKHIFDNLWLLNPSWERATKATEYMEKTVGQAFRTISESLSEEEKKARIDIGYRTAGGKHIIIELKRYKPTYKIDPFTLARQIDKYYRALEKCIIESDDNPNPFIETICIIGEHSDTHKREDFDKQLSSFNGRIYPYDQLIKESYESYSEYLKSEKKVGKLKELLDKI